METGTITTTVLIASDGYKLTQASDDIVILDRVIGKKIYLASNDSADNWKEITDEEAEALKAEKADAMAALEEETEDSENTTETVDTAEATTE